MEVIFRSNDEFAKKTLGQLGGAEAFLAPLERYLSDEALARLSLFVDDTSFSFATLDIVDGSRHVHSTYKDKNVLTAMEKVLKKCSNQLKNGKNESYYENDSIRYSTFEDSVELEDLSVKEDFELIEIENDLEKEKKTAQYSRIMNKYVNFLYREKEIERVKEHLRILYAIYNDVDKENITVADYERLTESIKQLNDELNSLLSLQYYFNNCKKDNLYIDDIISKELVLAKLKR